MSVGLRLKEERKRLGHSQEAWATACGTTKRTQIQYEKDEYSPTCVYLVTADQLGADVAYIVTGRHERMDEFEAEFVGMYRSAAPAARAAAAVALRGGLTHASVTDRSRARTEFNNANIGQAFSGDVDLRGQRIVVKRSKSKTKS